MDQNSTLKKKKKLALHLPNVFDIDNITPKL